MPSWCNPRLALKYHQRGRRDHPYALRVNRRRCAPQAVIASLAPLAIGAVALASRKVCGKTPNLALKRSTNGLLFCLVHLYSCAGRWCPLSSTFAGMCLRHVLRYPPQASPSFPVGHPQLAISMHRGSSHNRSKPSSHCLHFGHPVSVSSASNGLGDVSKSGSGVSVPHDLHRHFRSAKIRPIVTLPSNIPVQRSRRERRPADLVR